MEKTLTLSQHKPIANGSSRWVYQHPERHELLVKVLRYRLSDEPVASFSELVEQLTIRHRFARFMREVKEYMTIANSNADPITPHLPRITGLVETDVGFGIEEDAMRTADGELGPTFTKLARSKQLTLDHARALEQFLINVMASPVVVGDMNGKNLVFTETAANGYLCSLVDGLGDSRFIPLQSWFKWANNKHKRQYVNKLRRRYTKALTERGVEYTDIANLKATSSEKQKPQPSDAVKRFRRRIRIALSVTIGVITFGLFSLMIDLS